MRSAILLLFLAAFALADDALTYRELPCRVVDENGRPVPGLTVYLGGLDRDFQPYMADDERQEAPVDSKFTTDAEGRFVVRFGRFHFYDQPAKFAGDAGPGYGRFCLLATRKGSAGAVSRLIVNPADEDPVFHGSSPSNAGTMPKEREEWRWGEFAPLVLTDIPPAKPLDIVLKCGVEIYGRMVDTRGQPVRGRGIGVGQDLHYGSHTGAGGEIFSQSTTTDKSGRFRFRHVYPNRFQIEPGEGPPIRWTKTRVRRLWMDGPVTEIDPHTAGERNPTVYERAINVRLVVQQQRTYRYFGRVTDEQENPVSGLNVHIQPNWRHRLTGAYGDGPDGGQVRTDSQGKYSVRIGIPFADFLYSDGAGVAGGTETQAALLAPGRYDFVVHPKKPGE